MKGADLAKPDLVQRDQDVTLIYESAGLYLTMRGKALEGGTEGDVVNVMNMQSKRTVSGVVVGRNRVAIVVASARPEPAEQKIQDKVSDSTSAPGAASARPLSPRQRQPTGRGQTRVNRHVQVQSQFASRQDRSACWRCPRSPAVVRRSTACRRSARSRNCRRSRIRPRSPATSRCRCRCRSRRRRATAQLAVAQRLARLLQGPARARRSATCSRSRSTSPTRPSSTTRPSAAAPTRKIPDITDFVGAKMLTQRQQGAARQYAGHRFDLVERRQGLGQPPGGADTNVAAVVTQVLPTATSWSKASRRSASTSKSAN